MRLNKQITVILIILLLLFFLTLSLIFDVVFADQSLGIINVSIIDLNGISVYDLQHTNFSARIVKNGTMNLTGISRRVENSVSAGPSVFHNKTSAVYAGDVINLTMKDSSNQARDLLFLQRPSFFYSKNGANFSLTTSTALTSSCSIISSNNTFAQIDCIMSNSDGDLIVSYISSNQAQQFHSFNLFRSNKTHLVNLTNVGFNNYYDYDIANNTGSETQDEFYAVINSSKFGIGTTEQVTKEGRVICEGDPIGGDPNIINLTKCDSGAINDTFTVEQKLGTGISGNPIFLGVSIDFSEITPSNILIGFTNPSTDTDNKREVPPEEINISTSELINKFDISFVAKIVNGNLTKKGAAFAKFFGNSWGYTQAMLGTSATESISRRAFSFFDLKIFDDAIADAISGEGITFSGTRRGINLTAGFANTGTANIVNANATCEFVHSDNTVALHQSFLFNLSATEPIDIKQCDGTINLDNSLKPGLYNLIWSARDTAADDAETNFTIQKDFIGTHQSFLAKNNYTCNEQISFNYNLTNEGNQNFTANLTLITYYSPNGSFFKTLINVSDANLTKDSANNLITNTTYCEENLAQNFTANITFTVVDETNETETLSSSLNYRVLANAFHTFYGQATPKIVLGFGNRTLHKFRLDPKSNVYLADINSSFKFESLQALGLRANGSTSTTDFTDLDTVFNLSLTKHGETIKSLYSTDGTLPNQTETFPLNISGSLTNVPVTNSTVNGTFKFTTGILWDKDDDASLNGEFDPTDKEDIIFVTRTSDNQSTDLGITDYVIKIPAVIRKLKGGDSNIKLYLEVSG